MEAPVLTASSRTSEAAGGALQPSVGWDRGLWPRLADQLLEGWTATCTVPELPGRSQLLGPWEAGQQRGERSEPSCLGP